MEILDIENVMYEINKSKFLGFAYHIECVEDIETKLSNIRSIHSKATHVCFAYVIENPNLEKCSDDGEPDGTAGRPILEVIKKNGLTNVLVVVVRYFGGIKLGAGGLLRAYSTSAKNTIDSTTMVEYQKAVRYVLAVEVFDRTKLMRLVDKYFLDIVSQNYGEKYQIVADFTDLSKQDGFEFDLSNEKILVLSKSEIKKRK